MFSFHYAGPLMMGRDDLSQCFIVFPRLEIGRRLGGDRWEEDETEPIVSTYVDYCCPLFASLNLLSICVRNA